MENRPTLNRVWSSSGQNIRDPGDDKYASGWVAEIPTSEVFNFLQNKIDKTFLAIGERGIPEWGGDVSYKQGALVWNEVDGLIYIALAENPDSKTSPNLNTAQWAKSSVQISRVEFDALNSKITEHIAQHGEDNPHKLTPHDVGTYTQQEIDAMFSANDETNNAHISDMDNPHGDNAEKIGAVPVTGGTYEGPITFGSGVTELNAEGTALLDASSDVLNITVNGGGLGVDADGTPGLIKAAEGFTPFGTSSVADMTESTTDTTPGRVLKVGDYGDGVADGTVNTLSSIYDITCSGGYNALGDGTTTPTEGVPVGSGNTRFGVRAENIYPNQYLVSLISNKYFYVGIVNTSTKTATWSQFYNTLNKPSAGDVSALPLTGGTLTTDGAVITLLNSTAGNSNFILAKDADNATKWYIGNGSNSNYDAAFNNYKGGNNNIALRADGSINITATNGKNVGITGQAIPSNYSNFDARFQAKGNYTPAGQAYTKAESDARYGKGKTTTGSNNAYYTHPDGTVYMQSVRSIAVGNNASVTVTLPTSFPNGIIGVGSSYYGTGGNNSASYYFCTAVNKNQVRIDTQNCSGTFSLNVTGY